jgi:hypothetical protein
MKRSLRSQACQTWHQSCSIWNQDHGIIVPQRYMTTPEQSRDRAKGYPTAKVWNWMVFQNTSVFRKSLRPIAKRTC